MDDNKPNLDHQWTKEIRNKFDKAIADAIQKDLKDSMS